MNATMTAEDRERYQSAMRKMEQEKTIRFYYFRDDPSHNGPVLTACAILNHQDDGTTDIAVGFAFCSKKDRFVKEDGRLTALARAIGELPFKNGAQAFGYKRWSGHSQEDVIDIFNAMNPHNIPNPFKRWKLVKHTSVYFGNR